MLLAGRVSSAELIDRRCTARKAKAYVVVGFVWQTRTVPPLLGERERTGCVPRRQVD